jgi:FtsP/CotA-like multicopper oxidase with cupredoxin domain
VTPGADRSDAWSRRRFLHATGALLATSFAARVARPLTAGATAPARGHAPTRPTNGGGTGGTAVTLRPAPATVDLGGTVVDTWAYGGAVPGPLVRVTAGRQLTAVVENQLPEPTTVHWHGIALPFDMDGVPGVTQDPIAPGSAFTYQFTPAAPGTYFLHPHVGLQLDRGLYAPLVVDDPEEPGKYDEEWIVVLDDWTDGVGASPDQILAGLTGGGAASSTPMPGMATPAQPARAGAATAQLAHGASALLGGVAGDVRYPLYLVNGRAPRSPSTLATRAGARVRVRLINAGAETAFRVALTGHRLTLTHADGYAVAPVTAVAVLLGMGERVDATFTAGDGVFPLVAVAEGKNGTGRALLRTGSGRVPPASARPRELDGPVATLARLRPTAASRLDAKRPDRTFRVVLAGQHRPYRWTINGRTYGNDSPIVVDVGERVRLEFVNRSPMFHPMHLHGHSFAVLDGARRPGVRKDTVIVKPGTTVLVDFDADNSGTWMLHCHNAYHQEAGMMTSVYYSGA